MFPENVEGLKPVRINDLLYEKLSFHYKVNDQHLHGINTYFTWGLGSLILVWDQILKWEIALSNDKQKKVTVALNTLQLNELSLHLSTIRKLIDKGLHLLCAGNIVILLTRKQGLWSFFDPKFHYLLHHTNPVTEELLRDNVDLKIAESTKLSEAAHKLQVRHRHHNFRGRNVYRGNQTFRMIGNARGCHITVHLLADNSSIRNNFTTNAGDFL